MAKLKDGETKTLILRPGAGEKENDPPVERAVTGKIRSFEQDGETRWEIETGTPQWPAIGFDPDTAQFK